MCVFAVLFASFLTSSMTDVVADLISQCQIVAGHFCDVSPRMLVVEIRELLGNVPAAVSRPDQLVITEVLDRVLARLVAVAGLDTRADIAHGFVALANTRCDFQGWREQWLQLSERCAAVLSRGAASGVPCHSDPRVDRMIDFIDRNYAETRLDIRTVAEVAHVSSWHAARLLKEKSGSGFLAHLHRRRIAVARDLLVDTALTLKEISTRVGYAHPSQFTRHFKTASGITPLAYRALQVMPPKSA